MLLVYIVKFFVGNKFYKKEKEFEDEEKFFIFYRDLNISNFGVFKIIWVFLCFVNWFLRFEIWLGRSKLLF